MWGFWELGCLVWLPLEKKRGRLVAICRCNEGESLLRSITNAYKRLHFQVRGRGNTADPRVWKWEKNQELITPEEGQAKKRSGTFRRAKVHERWEGEERGKGEGWSS